MKHHRILILFLLTTALLCGCLREPSLSYTVTRDGKTFTVDTQNRTISDGQYEYAYYLSGNTVRITYPNGSTYTWNHEGNAVGSGGWSGDYNPEAYVDGETLVEVLSPDSDSGSGGRIALGLLLAALGLWQILAPRSVWFLTNGWRFKSAEPSDLALGLHRAGGVACLFFGVIAILSGL